MPQQWNTGIYLTLLLFYYSGQALLHDQSLFVSNLINGVDQYALPSMEHVKTFLYNIIQNYPLQIEITKDCGWLVSGGNDNFAHVFNLWTGTFVQCLDHRDSTIVLFPNSCFLTICVAGDLIQTVTVSTIYVLSTNVPK
jgi:hypothetical protein